MPLPLLSVRPLGDYVRALVLGAKSAIAQAIVERLDGYDFALAARGCSELEPFAADLRLRHSCEVELFEFDALDFAALARLPQQVHERGGPFDLVVLAFGYLGDERAAQRDTDETSSHPQRQLHWRGHCAGAFGQLSGGKGTRRLASSPFRLWLATGGPPGQLRVWVG